MLSFSPRNKTASPAPAAPKANAKRKSGRRPPAQAEVPAVTGQVKPFFRAALRTTPTGPDLEIMVYDVIGEHMDFWSGEKFGIGCDAIQRQMAEAGAYSSITMRINSPGGDVFEGVAILNMLRAQKKPVTVCVDGVAASAASVVAMAGDSILMGVGSMMMIHCAWSACMGNSDDMMAAAKRLSAIDQAIASTYASRTDIKLEDLGAMMKQETWLSAEEAIAKGFADGMQERAQEMTEEERGAAMQLAQQYRDRVEKLAAQNSSLRVAAAAEPDEEMECECDCQACQDGKCENCTNLACNDENCEDCPMQANAKAMLQHDMACVNRAAVYALSLNLGEDFRNREIIVRNEFTTPVLNLAPAADKSSLGMISGKLAPYNSPSANLGGFVEVYERGCFNKWMKEDDILSFANHDMNRQLGATSNGTLRFIDKSDGLHYEVDLPDTGPARDLKALMDRKDPMGSSAAFFITDYRMEIRNGVRTRVVLEARLLEGGPHPFAAYKESSAHISKNDDNMNNENRAENGLEKCRVFSNKLRLLKIA